LESENVKVEVGGMLALVEMADEKEESGLSKMLTELNLADKYLHKLNSDGVDVNDLKELMSSA